MSSQITSIKLPLPFRMGTVNCYLIATEEGYVLIDTGGPKNRKQVEAEMLRAGCEPGSLKLILITHGDFDHTGNAAYLRKLHGCQIAMHRDDLRMAEQGDMFANRKTENSILRKLVPLFTGFGKAERFTPDLLVEDGGNLADFGFQAGIVSVPGHSKGSVGALLGNGDFFCGDLLSNVDRPMIHGLTDDLEEAQSSVRKIRGLEIRTIYPGHGEPFQFSEFARSWEKDGTQ